jgi:PadR family transcriptional regulator, regulatory protein PadR
MGKAPKSSELLPGTLDLLILRALVPGSMHGYGIASRLKHVSGDVLEVRVHFIRRCRGCF